MLEYIRQNSLEIKVKKILFIALMCLLTSVFVGCELFEEKMSLGDAADGEREEYEGAVMRHVSSTDTSLTVYLENTTDSVWQSGNMRDYSLEAERDGKWYTVEQIGELANTMELMLFAPGDTLTHTFEFSERYGKLTAGRYRVVKSWWANESETREAGEFYLVCEFTVN